MSASQITTYVADALAQLPMQFKGKERIEALVTILVNRFQILEDALFPLSTLTSIDQSVGTQLDGLGRLLDEARQGRSDTDYRVGLKIRIAVLNASGTADAMLDVLQWLFEPDFLQMSEYFPAGFLINMSPIDDVNAVNRLIQLVKPLAVEYSLSESNDLPFATSRLMTQSSTGDVDTGFAILTDPNRDFLALGVQAGDEVNTYDPEVLRATVLTVSTNALTLSASFSTTTAAMQYDVRRNAPQPSGGYSSVAFPTAGGKYVSLA